MNHFVMKTSDWSRMFDESLISSSRTSNERERRMQCSLFNQVEKDVTMLDKNSPERPVHPDSDDDEIQMDPNDAVEIIDIDPNDDEMVENQMDDLDLQQDPHEEEDDDSIKKITRHQVDKSIFSISIDPRNQQRVCSGGEDDRCLVWRLDTGDLIHEYSPFDDSVHQVCWSFDGKYLCACDMRGQIRCWTDDDNGIPQKDVWAFHTGSDIELMRFHPSAHVLFVGTNDSQLWMFKIPSGEYKIMHGGSDTELLNLEILSNGKQCVCGYGNGQVKLWDLKQCSIVWQYDCQTEMGENASSETNPKCISMSLNNEQTLIGCGAADGNCRVFNLNNGRLLSTFACFQRSTNETTPRSVNDDDDDDDEEADESTSTTIESVLFGANHLLICGTLAGFVYLWDMNRKSLRTTLNLQSGIVKCLLNENYLLYVACLDGHIRLLDIRSGDPLKEWKSGGGQGCEIMDMIMSVDQRYLLCAYMQGSCRIFQLKE